MQKTTDALCVGKSTADERQIGGNHYKLAIEPWNYIIANKLGYLEGTAIKYISRWRNKGGIEDIHKAIHFLQKLIETESTSETALGSNKLSFASGVLSVQSSANIMGRLHGTNNVAGYAWNGLPTDPEFLQNPNALDELHMKT